MAGLLKRAIFAVLGVAVMLGYWTLKGGPKGHDSMDRIPAKVWEGGSAVTAEIEVSGPSRVSAVFERTGEDKDREDEQLLEAWQTVPAGRHEFVIDVPPNLSGTLEAIAENPAVGATSRVALRVGTTVATEDKQALEQPLEEGHAFGAQIEIDDWATGRPEP